MIKKITFIVLFIVAFVNNAMCNETNEDVIEIDLTSSYDNTNGALKPRTRSLGKAPKAYTCGHVISFEYFDLPLTIELEDVDNNVVFNTTVGFGVNNIEVPVNLTGTFIIKFINYEAECWGYLVL